MTNNYEDMDYEKLEKMHELSRMEAALVGYYKEKAALHNKLKKLEQNMELQKAELDKRKKELL